MAEHKFDFDSGALCLDFANTVEWHAGDQPQEKLVHVVDLIDWAEAAKILSSDGAHRLRHLSKKQPQRAGEIFARAIELREALYRLFVTYSEQGSFEARDLSLLNEVLRESLAHLQLVPAAEGFDWGWVRDSAGLEQILWPVARSAGELLISDRLSRVRQCADNRGCGYLFVDTSRNRSRRWCSMESCGNRAKAHRHYRRRQEKTG
ncbi:MAG: ABATE domain-containing protein [Candidatus Promineifilaceae bacterium]|nr:ABATE domain-containing protein [Candidatus Promineifilaceae bacterium]